MVSNCTSKHSQMQYKPEGRHTVLIAEKRVSRGHECYKHTTSGRFTTSHLVVHTLSLLLSTILPIPLHTLSARWNRC